MRMSSGVEKLLLVDRLNINGLSIQSYNLVTDGWNFIKLYWIYIYGNDVIIHIRFFRITVEVVSCREVIAL